LTSARSFGIKQARSNDCASARGDNAAIESPTEENNQQFNGALWSETEPMVPRFSVQEVSGAATSRSGEVTPVPDLKPATTIDWEAVRRAYELGSESVSKIQKLFGLTPWQLRCARERGDWTTRPAVAKPGPLQGYKPIGAEALELKLNRLVAIGAAMLERKIADEGMTETNARTLKELCRAQETSMRSKRTEKAAKAREKKNNDAGYDFRDDPAWLDAEFERRITRIFGAGASSLAGDDAAAKKGAPGGLAGKVRREA